MSDTDRSELRDTLPPDSIEGQVRALEAAVGELRAAQLLLRTASERCADACMAVVTSLDRVLEAQSDQKRRLSYVERYLGVQP